MRDVVLVSMPFGALFSPSLGLSLLQAELRRHGVEARVRYFSLRFAESIGQDFYSGLASSARVSVCEMAGEWIFSGALFGDSEEKERRYVKEILEGGAAWVQRADHTALSAAQIERILHARRLAPAFLDDCLEEILRDRPRILGFTSVFQQHLASLALAKRLKAKAPETFIVFGGANCEDVMGAETVRQFPFVDAAVAGEGERVVPELVRRVLAGESPAGLPGVRTRETIPEDFARGAFSGAPPVREMDQLPFPDYGGFFAEFSRSRYARYWQPSVYFESSRGCWWGERAHCTFCGLNGETMVFRSKSARRAVDEIVLLAKSWPGSDIEVVDNILDLRYFQDMLPELAARKLGLTLFYETKANLRKDQIRLLRRAGVARIQPGIESFSDSVLKLMRKGVTALQNIQLLKWCKELGVNPAWNLLWGFAGEDPGEYARTAELVPLLTHLPPPIGIGGIRLDRFSPNFFDAERLGYTDVRPLPSYSHVYPLPEGVVANLAYYFSHGYADGRDPDTYARPLVSRLRQWQRTARRSDLFFVDLGDLLALWDLRPVARRRLSLLRGIERELYLACDAAADIRQLAERAAPFIPGPALEETERQLAPLVRAGLLIRDGARYLALALPLGEYAPAPAIVDRFYGVARSLAVSANGRLVVPLSAAAPQRRGAVRSSPPATKPRLGRGRNPRLTPAHFSLNRRGELVIR